MVATYARLPSDLPSDRVSRGVPAVLPRSGKWDPDVRVPNVQAPRRVRRLEETTMRTFTGRANAVLLVLDLSFKRRVNRPGARHKTNKAEPAKFGVGAM